MIASWSLQLLVASLSVSGAVAHRPSKSWKERDFKTLVTFGDSYTDENRLGYFISHNGSAPPVGWDQPLVRHHNVMGEASPKPF